MAFKESAIPPFPKTATWIKSELRRLEQSQDPTAFSDFNAGCLASRFGITSRQLQRHFHDAFKISPKHWLNEKRMRLARGLLARGEPTKAVAYQLGFKQPSHFCTAFKDRYKISPLDVHQEIGPKKSGQDLREARPQA